MIRRQARRRAGADPAAGREPASLARWPSGEEVCAQLARETDTVMLAFSRGKDSIAAWIAMRPHFKRIIPVYMYKVPGLEFVADSIKYFEDRFGERVRQYPHPVLYHWLENGLFTLPARQRTVWEAGLPTFSEEQLFRIVREDEGLPASTWLATGIRAWDNSRRLAHIAKVGPRVEKTRKFYPVWDWRIERLEQEIRGAGIRLPVDYEMFGRSFDALTDRYLPQLRERFPDDYRRILDLFPLAGAMIARKMLYRED